MTSWTFLAWGPCFPHIFAELTRRMGMVWGMWLNFIRDSSYPRRYGTLRMFDNVFEMG